MRTRYIGSRGVTCHLDDPVLGNIDAKSASTISPKQCCSTTAAMLRQTPPELKSAEEKARAAGRGLCER